MKLFCFFIVFTMFCTLNAAPMVVKGVDGTWLPVLAASWTEKNNGVLVILKENIGAEKLREKLSEMFPNLRIEVSEKALFFISTNIESLFSMLNGADTGINLPEKNLKNISDRLVVDNSAEKMPDGVEGTVESLFFDTTSGRLLITVMTKTGKKVLQITYKMKDGVADTNDESNKRFSSLLLLKKGAVLIFVPVKINNSRLLTVSDYLIKRN